MDIVEGLFVVEFQDSIDDVIPHIIALFRPWNLDVCEVGANTLVKLSKHGKVSIILTQTLLMYSY